MELIINILIALIAFIHIYIMCFEMFLWEKRGPKIFKKFKKDLFPKTIALAANQGLYNGFLAAGLIWALIIQDANWSENVAMFFLCCVSIAGIFGAITAERKIFFIQTLPALIALGMILLKVW